MEALDSSDVLEEMEELRKPQLIIDCSSTGSKSPVSSPYPALSSNIPASITPCSPSPRSPRDKFAVPFPETVASCRARNHPYVDDGLKCFICGLSRVEHICSVSPRVQESMTSFEGDASLYRDAYRNRQRGSKPWQYESSSVLSAADSETTVDTFNVEDDSFDEGQLLPHAPPKGKSHRASLAKKRLNSAFNRVRNVSRISVITKKRFSVFNARPSNATENKAVVMRKLHFNGMAIRVVPARVVGGACFWLYEDVCRILQYSSKSVLDTLEQGKDYQHIQVKGHKSLVLTEVGLLRLSVRRRSQTAVQFHRWCMRYRIENSAFYMQQGSSEGNVFEFDIEKVILEARKIFLQRVSKADGWHYLHDRDCVHIYVQKFADRHKDPYLHVKCIVNIAAPPTHTFKHLTNVKSWVKWDPNVKDVKFISEVKRDEGVAKTSTDIIRITWKPFNPLEGMGLGGSFGKMVHPNTLRGRDVCVLKHCHESFHENSMMLHSVAWQSCPLQKGIVRAKLRSSGFLVEPSKATDGSNDDRACICTHVFVVDMKSGAHRQPEFLKNFICEQRPLCLLGLKAAVEANYFS